MLLVHDNIRFKISSIKKNNINICIQYVRILTIDWCFARKDDHNQLQTNIRHLEVFEHGLHAVCSLGVFTETWLALNGHASILGDFSKLVSEAPVENHETLRAQ